jgi:hypothetical protein
MRGKADNGRALTLAQLARGAANVVALRRWADNDSAARWRGGIGGLRAGQHNNNRPSADICQLISMGQIIR